jgi:hypothetical protein
LHRLHLNLHLNLHPRLTRTRFRSRISFHGCFDGGVVNEQKGGSMDMSELTMKKIEVEIELEKHRIMLVDAQARREIAEAEQIELRNRKTRFEMGSKFF